MSCARSGALLVLLVGSASMANPTRGQEQAFAFDGSRSSARFVVHTRITPRSEGVLSGVSGTLNGAPAQGWRVIVMVDGRSLRFAGPRWMDRITRSDSFLAVERHPAIRFESGAFTDAALREGGDLRGDLTLRGLTQPVSFRLLPSTCARIGRECDIQVEGTISRHAFGMNAYRALVKDDVEFQMRVRLSGDLPGP